MSYAIMIIKNEENSNMAASGPKSEKAQVLKYLDLLPAKFNGREAELFEQQLAKLIYVFKQLPGFSFDDKKSIPEQIQGIRQAILGLGDGNKLLLELLEVLKNRDLDQIKMTIHNVEITAIFNKVADLPKMKILFLS